VGHGSQGWWGKLVAEGGYHGGQCCDPDLAVFGFDVGDGGFGHPGPVGEFTLAEIHGAAGESDQVGQPYRVQHGR
jgi:hypothetical protein